MKEELREKAGLIYNVVEGVILAMSIGLTCWCADRIVIHGEMLSADRTQIQSNTSRIESIDAKGSRGLESQRTSTDDLTRRIEKLETAVIALQSAPGELKAINVRLDGIVEGQRRIEKALDDHLKLK